MCGLAGLVHFTQHDIDNRRAALVFDALSRRGPDAHGVWREDPCTLLHCRLRIIDVACRSDQPMERRDGNRRVVMVFNGEIYNYRELRNSLISAGWAFSTSSDAEVFLAGYMAWGEDVFRRARGMWAVAFWDPVDQRLTLARDPLGKKPLLYRPSIKQVAFASNMRALLPLLDATPPIDEPALDCYLAHLVVPFEHSIFKGVHKVPPGGIVVWSPDAGAAVRRFWEPPAQVPAGTWDDEAELEWLLRRAVRRRLESDVPLGVFLSAGLDSSLVAAITAEESGRRLVAFTAGTTGSGYDERQPARLVAMKYGMEHRPLEVPELSARSLPTLMAELGEPFGDSSLIPSYEVARAARQEITVALTGDGGDEAFFGYQTFRGVTLAAVYRRLVPRHVRRLLWKSTRSFTADDWRRKLGAVFEYGVLPLSASFRNRMGFATNERASLLRRGPVLHDAEHIYADRLSRWSNLPDADALRHVLYETYLPNDYLTKVDTSTMAASLEARCPFLDVDLVDFALRMPQSVTFPRGKAKAFLRPLARRMLPEAIISRPKTGFGVPVAQWMRGPLANAMEEFVFRPGGIISDLISQSQARAFYDAHRRGADHSTRLWGLLALGVWCAVIVEARWLPTDSLPVV
jgi:asparagine synthase (glutamine-hydrolysing)